MDGSGYDCKVRGEDSRGLGNAVCKQLNATITNKDGYCPDGYTLATYSDALTLPALEGRGFLIQRDDLFNQAGARKNRGLLSPSVEGL
ncbi:hypothetical protein BJP34_13600 [Moorena producens PAL-8-15-08-1]|uniref:Uncharacterized protein n=2 Tax=Coleofasciculaceae TaxID=1892251 RepID=A0A1D8TRR8_9CYAN|nr:hypothetical protein BJP34_13600 [Moorena producens PAL-8-15-08-1]